MEASNYLALPISVLLPHVSMRKALIRSQDRVIAGLRIIFMGSNSAFNGFVNQPMGWSNILHTYVRVKSRWEEVSRPVTFSEFNDAHAAGRGR